jgi:hypothetical protein
MFQFLVNQLKHLKQNFKKAVNFVFKPKPPAFTVTHPNFDFTKLCPSGVSIEEGKAWLELYLRQMPANSILLWTGENQGLMLSILANNKAQHISLPRFVVDAETREISYQGERVFSLHRFNEILTPMMGHPLPNTVRFPSPDELQNKKFLVYLSQKMVTNDMVKEIKKTTTRLLDNFDQCAQCIICLEKYTNENPATLLIKTGLVFHEACLKTHFTSQYTQGLPLTCPQTNTVVFAIEYNPYRQRVNFDIKNLITPDLSYKAVLGNGDELFTSVRNMCTMLDIFIQEREENKRLRAELLKQQEAFLLPPAYQPEPSAPPLPRLNLK